MQTHYRVRVGSYWVASPADVRLTPGGEDSADETVTLTNDPGRAYIFDKEGAVAWATLLNGTASKMK